MSCAKHNFFAPNSEFVHKVVHNFAQTAVILGKHAFSASRAVNQLGQVSA